MLPISCTILFLKGTSCESGLLIPHVLRLVHMFVMKGPTKYEFCPAFARPLSSFFEGARSLTLKVFAGTIFFKK